MSDSSSPQTPASGENTEEPRRNFLYAFASVVIGAMIGVIPVVLGIVSFLNPLSRKRKIPVAFAEAEGTAAAPEMVRVCSLEALAENGTPQRFPVIDNQIDAWNFTPSQPVGSLYIQRLSGEDLRIFNTTCPHAGCSVSCDGKTYNCPCHNSAFNLDGSKLTAESGRENPSPRDLDTLEFNILDGDVWVKFQNFYTGREHKEAKQ